MGCSLTLVELQSRYGGKHIANLLVICSPDVLLRGTIHELIGPTVYTKNYWYIFTYFYSQYVVLFTMVSCDRRVNEPLRSSLDVPLDMIAADTMVGKFWCYQPFFTLSIVKAVGVG